MDEDGGLSRSKNVIVGPIRDLAGAADVMSTGDEANLVSGFLRERSASRRRRLFLTEVPIPGGIADLVEVRLRSPYLPSQEIARPEVAALAGLEDRFLYVLASLRRGVGYRRGSKQVVDLSDVELGFLRGHGLLDDDGALVRRTGLLADHIASVDIYEFKSRIDGRVLQQAARRVALGSRVWVAAADVHQTGGELMSRAETLGVGVVDALSGRVALRPRRSSGPASWARFEVARQAARGRYGGPSAKSA